jgi:hypothetical protein
MGESARVKGTKITSKLAFVRHTFGDSIAAEVVASLPAEDRVMLENLVHTEWYSVDLYARVLEAVCTIAADGNLSIYDQIGSYSADHQIQGTYAAFAAEDPMRVLRKSARMHGLLNDPAEMEFEVGGERACALLVREPRSTSVICRVARAFYKRLVERTGVSHVTVDEPFCSGRGAPLCRFEIAWQ